MMTTENLNNNIFSTDSFQIALLSVAANLTVADTWHMSVCDFIEYMKVQWEWLSKDKYAVLWLKTEMIMNDLSYMMNEEFRVFYNFFKFDLN